MSRLPPLPDAHMPESASAMFEIAENMMGFTPNDARDMARNPAILSGVAAMCSAVYADGQVSQGLKRLIGYVASTVAGCKYCRSHTAHGAMQNGVDPEKIAAAWTYEDSPLFSEAERAALKVAHLGSLTPSEVTDADFAELRKHFSDNAVIEIIAVISMFGFLNRWNAVMDTDIEAGPQATSDALGLGL
jgi:uncharacterized peroxidase-related enzyme